MLKLLNCLHMLAAEAEVPPSTQVQQNLHCAHIHYNPSLQQQRTVSPKGINADFVLQYDVEQTDLMGDIQVMTLSCTHRVILGVVPVRGFHIWFICFLFQVHNGHFVHYFSPRGLPVVSKEIIFVIDISGSMIGTKIKQVS